MSQFKSIDLFAGIGGIRMGFDNACGEIIKTVFVSEWDENAQKTYRANFSDDFEIAGDITKINESEIPAFDTLLPYSQAMVRELGIYRDTIPMEKEGSL